MTNSDAESLPRPAAEWLETDGAGGFAMGAVAGPRTRRYHGLLIPATRPPEGRLVLVAGLDAWLEPADGEPTRLFPQRYWPGVLAPAEPCRLLDFRAEPWPTWTLEGPGGVRIEHEIFIHRPTRRTVLRWRLREDAPAAAGALRLGVRPLLAGRDYHALQSENGSFDFTPADLGAAAGLRWTPYAGLPPACLWTDGGEYRHDPVWYRGFQYVEEQARGMDFLEDLASPGGFRWPLAAAGQAVWLVLGADDAAGEAALTDAGSVSLFAARAMEEERARRGRFPTPRHRAADAYLVRGARGRTIIAGYPWFADWGRDTFISLRGLCLATGRLEEAGEILLHWAGQVSGGMLPNRFPEGEGAPEFNSVDAALWFIVAAAEWLELTREGGALDGGHEDTLWRAVEAILDGYAGGTRYGIRLDPADGLLAAGAPGWQLTWMDARADGREVTPRIGKPVEIQALWINCLRLAEGRSPRWRELRERAGASFAEKFWNEAAGGLFDVVDAGHQPGVNDASVRPNQIPR